MTKQELIDFEQDIADIYDTGVIGGPIHLCGSVNGEQEEALIGIFKDFKDSDWIFTYHRNHYHWLLSGKDPEDLKEQILDGKSMHVNGDKFFGSGILGGQAPIAVGVAMALKRKGSKNKVWCFMGDMGASLGLAYECIKYAEGHDLPIKFVIEDNGFSVNTKTQEVWGKKMGSVIKGYVYERTKWGHHGTGRYILF